jgi:hypothetical protein
MAPYYHHLKQSGDADGLKQYESLVNQLVQRVEFYQTPESQRFHMAFSSHPTMKAASQAWHDYKIATAGSVAEFNRKARQDKTFAKEAKARRLQLFIQAQSSIPRSAVTQILERHTEPLADKATRYAIAANLAELCFRQPERALELLDASRPLRVLAHKDFISGDIGNFNAGINLIEVSTPQLWMARPYATIAQHEGVHAMSDQAGLLTKGLLPRMSDRQEKRFIDARSAMRHIYETQDNTLSGRLRFALTGITATGIRPYAFHADYEFLTVTLDTFSRNPKALCKTEPGRELYGIYKALFGIDPLRELYGK